MDGLGLFEQQKPAPFQLGRPFGDHRLWLTQMGQQEAGKYEIRASAGKRNCRDIVLEERHALVGCRVCQLNETSRSIEPDYTIASQCVVDQMSSESGAATKVQDQGKRMDPAARMRKARVDSSYTRASNFKRCAAISPSPKRYSDRLMLTVEGLKPQTGVRCQNSSNRCVPTLSRG